MNNIKRQNLTLYRAKNNNLRTVIKTKHGRLVYLELHKDGYAVTVKKCYYIDRMRGGEYYAVPQKATTVSYRYDEIISIVAAELDRVYFGLEISEKFPDLEEDEFIDAQFKIMQRKYNFLIFIGEGELINGIPSIIRTRLKNRIHRSIYIEMQYKDGKGIITDCHYYDRKYKGRTKVVPESLSTVFFKYNRQAILNIINNELNTAFSHIIFVTDGSLDIDNKVALCGNI